MINCLKATFLFLSLFIVSLGVESCGSAKTSNTKSMFEENPPFKIEEAYFQKWVAGIKEGGSGINVYLIFRTIDHEVVIQDIYFQNQIRKMQNSLKNHNEYVARLSNNSRKDVVMDIDPMKEAQNTPSQNFPFELKENEAVVSYLFKGKKNYFKIPNLTEKNQIAYPQSNPHERN